MLRKHRRTLAVQESVDSGKMFLNSKALERHVLPGRIGFNPFTLKTTLTNSID